MIGAGVRLVVAKSFARIFFRNAVNNGLAVVVDARTLRERSPTATQITADLRSGIATVAGKSHSFTPLPAEVLSILVAGGLWAARSAQRDAQVPA